MNSTALTWGKIVLLFQAVITLLIGIVFFLQITELDKHGIQELTIILSEAQEGDVGQYEYEVLNITKRFKVAGYMLLIISLIEIMIVSRFID